MIRHSTISWFEHDRWFDSGVITPFDDKPRCLACTALVGHAHADDCPIRPQLEVQP